MKTTLLKAHSYFFSFMLMLLLGADVKAQIAYWQGFNAMAFPPAGWTMTNYSGMPLWGRVANGGNPTTTPLEGTGMARFHSDVAPPDSMQTLITPVVDYSAITVNDTARIRLWVFRDTTVSAIGDSLTIMVNTVASPNGATRIGGIARSAAIALPNSVGASGWYRYTFDVPASFNTNTNYLMIQGTSQMGNNIFVDSIAWTAYPPLCSGIPTGGNITANPPTLCGGGGTSQLTLTGTFIGLAGISYQWQSSTSSTGPWTNFGGNTTAVNSAIAVTTYYRCVISCSYSAMSDSSTLDSVIVNTNPLPTVLGSPVQSNYCSNATTGVMLTASGAAAYAWAPATGLSATTGDTVYAAPPANQTYVLTGYDSLGCADTAHVGVALHNPPNVTMVTPNDSICAGDSAQVTAQAFAGGLTYLWQPGGETTQTIHTLPATTTLYIVTVTTTFGCARVDSQLINVLPNPVASFSYTINGHTVIFIDNSSNATTWFWNFGDGNASFSQNPVYTYSSDTTVVVTLIVTGVPCGNDTITDTLQVYTAGIAELNSGNEGAIYIYPNPLSNSAQMIFALNKPEKVNIRIYDVLGREIEMIADKKLSAGTHSFTINRNGMQAGSYFVRIISDDISLTQKIMIE